MKKNYSIFLFSFLGGIATFSICFFIFSIANESSLFAFPKSSSETDFHVTSNIHSNLVEKIAGVKNEFIITSIDNEKTICRDYITQVNTRQKHIAIEELFPNELKKNLFFYCELKV